jgi:putative hydrolase of the HAD superfamily
MNDICVVFDVDDTLYLERDYVASGFRAVGQWAAVWLSIADFDTRCLDLFDNGHRGNVFDAALRACGREPIPELISGMVAIYRNHHPEIKMADDAAKALEEIRAVWPVSVITDGPVISQSRKCEALGLRGLADPIVLTGIWGTEFHKPETGAFKFVAGHIKARTYVYVADNPAKDFNAPQQLGWHSVRIRRKGGLHFDQNNDLAPPDFELSDCSNLGAVLSGIVRGNGE